jgi:hypothetical protein
MGAGATGEKMVREDAGVVAGWLAGGGGGTRPGSGHGSRGWRASCTRATGEAHGWQSGGAMGGEGGFIAERRLPRRDEDKDVTRGPPPKPPKTRKRELRRDCMWSVY